jgi:uncharacterized repeat protein (TIGR01451 family)
MVRSMTKRGMPKPFAILIAALLALYFVPLGALPASAADDVEIVPGGENCNGIIVTPGSENTLKDIVGGDLQPGGTVTFRISYPANPADVGQVFQITDCFMKRIAGTPGVDYKANTMDPLPGSPFTINFVPNNNDFTFDYTLNIPDDVALGTEICNYAKTTQGPSDPQQSNRKGGICFTVGGTLRIEKRDAQTNDLLSGAKFTVSCDPAVSFPSVVISGLESARPDGTPVTGNPATGYANDGFIAIAGPEGTPCTVTELEAPPGGYILPADASRTYTIPRVGSSDATKVFLNTRTGALKITKIADAAGTFTFDVSCTDGTTASNVSITIDAQHLGQGVSADLISGIPTGTVCTVTEDNNPDFSTTVDPAGGVVTIGTGTNTVTFTNARLLGKIKIKKVVSGDVAGASTSFVAHVNCPGDAYDQDVALNEDNGWVNVTGNIPTGLACTVTEPAAGIPAGWVLTGLVPADGVVTVSAGTPETVSVTITNERVLGKITVTKNLVGAANGASTSFTFDVDCPGTAYDQSLVVNVINGSSASATTGLIPTGVSCTVTERSTPDWNQTSVVPAGGAVSVPATVTFTNTRKQGVLNVSKAVSPVAGNGVVVNFGDTLTYTLTVSATGEATQHAVKVSDYIPGYDPARPTSGKTTYVAGSATCVGAGTCTVTGPDSAHLLTWQLGDMAAGTTRQVTFKVTIDDVTGAAGETVAVDILNAGAVESVETPKKPSNQVTTPVSKVLPVKVHKPPVVVLPHTGATLPVGPTVGGAIALLGLGLLLVAAGRRRPSWMPRR